MGEQPGAGAGAPAVASRKARQLAKKQAQVEVSWVPHVGLTFVAPHSTLCILDVTTVACCIQATAKGCLQHALWPEQVEV